MKLVTFTTADDTSARVGALTDDGAHIVALAAGHERFFGGAEGAFRDMLALIAAGPRALERADSIIRAQVMEAVTPLHHARLLAPVPVPVQIRDFSAFELHLLQCSATIPTLDLPGVPRMAGPRSDAPAALPQVWYQQPIYYKGNRLSVVGPEADVIWPPYSQCMDYELEFGVFIGKTGRDIPAQRASEYIFGYTIYNDFSARDAQLREMPGLLGPAKGKDFDTGNAMGPWLVTADEITNPYALDMAVRVNGVERGRGSSASMRYRFEDMIAHVSQGETLHSGEFLGSGTVGNGCGLESGRFLAHGDCVELEVSGLGILRNRVRRQEQQ